MMQPEYISGFFLCQLIFLDIVRTRMKTVFITVQRDSTVISINCASVLVFMKVATFCSNLFPADCLDST